MTQMNADKISKPQNQAFDFALIGAIGAIGG